jgi:hypothetical protein
MQGGSMKLGSGLALVCVVAAITGCHTIGTGGIQRDRIHSGASQPQDAYVAVRYRNLWFWVDDRDLPSKRVFTFLRMFSSIAETGVTPQLPLLTIPAN